MYRRLAVISLQLEELGLTHKTYQGMLLRRLVHSDDIEPLRTLVSIIEPVKEYRRYQMREQTMLSPLTGVVDAAAPDSEAGRRFAMMVDGFLGDAPRFLVYRAEISKALADWQAAGVTLEPMIARLPALKEIKPFAKNLSDIGDTGLQAVSFLKLGSQPSTEWRDARLAVLEEAAKPKAALEFAVIPSVRQLIVAASEIPQLSKMTKTEWRDHIKKLATKDAKAPGQ
jgi:hexosaminidase